MIRAFAWTALVALVAAPAGAQPSTAAGAAPAVDYARDVLPILSSKCFGCHGPRQAQSGLRLDLRQNAMRGGDYGVVIVPGNARDSKLIKRLVGSDAGLQMPPTGALAPEEIAVLRAWIDAGADMPGNALESMTAAKPTDPRVQDLIDAIGAADLPLLREAIAKDPALARAADGNGSTLLMHAAAEGTIDTMTALLDAGADVNAANQRGATALHWAVLEPGKLALLLARGAQVDAMTVERRTPLAVAAMQPDGAAAVERLLDAGASVDAPSIIGMTPLFGAAATSAATTRLLLHRGANPNARAQTGVTPIMFTRDADVVGLLIAHGAEVRASSKRGDQAIHDAAARGDLEAVRLLLEAGADVNATDFRGYTPLLLAAHYDGDAIAVVRLLLERGADARATTEGHTAMRMATRRGNIELEKLLRDAAARRVAEGASR